MWILLIDLIVAALGLGHDLKREKTRRLARRRARVIRVPS
jgi:hypothetical protein